MRMKQKDRQEESRSHPIFAENAYLTPTLYIIEWMFIKPAIKLNNLNCPYRE